MLGLGRRTSNTGVYGETARFPLATEIVSNIVMKYSVRVRESPIKGSLLYKAFQKNEELSGMIGTLSNAAQYILKELKLDHWLNKRHINRSKLLKDVRGV